MSAALVVQIVGALLILVAFMLSQASLLDPRSNTYLLLNAVGSAILTVLAFQIGRWGFALLEGVWTLVSLGGLIARWQGKETSSGH